MMNFQIKETTGYTPKIGELVSMLDYTRAVTLEDVKGLSTEQLDFLADEHSNSIGALILHMAAIEYIHQIIAFENRDLTQQELERWIVPFELGSKARSKICNQPLKYYLDELADVREKTLALMKGVEDDWLYEEGQYYNGVTYNKYYLWFHVVEDETSHRGQIRMLKRMLDNRKN